MGTTLHIASFQKRFCIYNKIKPDIQNIIDESHNNVDYMPKLGN